MTLIDLNYGENYKAEIDLKHYLEAKIAKKLNIPPENVLLNYGANSNLILFFSAYSNKLLREKRRRLKVLLDVPNYFFTLHQIKQWNVNASYVNRDSEFNFQPNQFIKTIKSFRPDAVVLTTPNNPTGKPIDNAVLDKVIRVISKETIVLIDRACINTLQEISTEELLAKYSDKQLIVLHSFSKSHTLSDSRVGYFATNQENIANLLFKKPDLNHNLNALQKLSDVIDDKQHVTRKKRTIKECNKILKREFSRIDNSTYYESHSNFAVIKLPCRIDSIRAEKHFAENNLLIMGGHRIGLGSEYIRIHMSGVKEIKKFIKCYNSISTIV